MTASRHVAGPLTRLLVVVAAAKCLLALVGQTIAVWSAGAGAGERPPPHYLVLLGVFGVAAATLLIANRDDRRAVSLGGFFAICAAAFADPLTSLSAAAFGDPIDSVLRFVAGIPLDAFLPLFLWLFVKDFPSEADSLRPRRTARMAVRLAQSVGWTLLAANVVLAFGNAGRFAPSTILNAFSRTAANSLFAPIIFALAAPALAYALWRARTAPVDERRRVGLFLGGIVLGFGPLVVAILLEAAIPAVHALMERRGIRTAFGWIIYPALLSIPFTTAYAVVVHRALDVRLVVRKAIQYALARWTVVGVTVIPIVALIFWVWRRRDETIASLAAGGGPIALVVVSASGVAGIVYGKRWFDAIDRRFFREAYDARRILLGLVEKSRSASAPSDLAELWMRELDRALHLESVAVLVMSPLRDSFASAAGSLRDLPASSALARMLAEGSDPMDVDLESPRSALRRLPRDDREWLGDAGAQLLQPLIASDGTLAGFLALGPKRSELPFSDEDRELLSAVAAAGTLTLENRILRSSPRLDSMTHPADDAGSSPAGECAACGAVEEAASSACRACGGPLSPAPVPLLLRGKFRVERRIGAGGMGVVYRATDVDLRRKVALKLLPRVSPELALRLRREARAMAAVEHPNLATIYGLELWRAAPVLLVEYLEGGTLADRLVDGPLPPAEAAEIAMVLTGVLERVHDAGLLHRDIKPSNIGFAGSGAAKLLDFGLVRLLIAARAGGETTATLVSSADARETLASSVRSLTLTNRLVGTPLYVSPEAARGERPSAAFDLWSLAVTLYEAIAGANPFWTGSLQTTLDLVRRGDPPDVRTYVADCPEGLASFLASALAFERAARPSSAREFRDRLAGAMPRR